MKCCDPSRRGALFAKQSAGGTASAMNIIELNVGGRKFTTTRDTLCKDADSMLAAMFSGDFMPAHQDSKGRVFLDRNGDMFAVILSYLRGEPLQVPDGVVQQRALVAEAHFFQVLHFYLAMLDVSPGVMYTKAFAMYTRAPCTTVT